MGFNSTLIVLNDRLHEIAETPDYGKQVADAIQMHGYDHRKPYVVGTEVITVNHADITNIIASGGNHASVMMQTMNGGRHHRDEDKLSLLKRLADEMGYHIRKKPTRKK
tara:strand:- start:9656 stop:9982 length:327 start_codon:yes stop_codon:yes gene_type:complete